MTTKRALTAAQTIFYGTLVVGTLDFTYASVASLVRGSTPARTWRFVASGLIGKAAINGGVPAMLLGIAIHYFIACGVVCTYFVVSRRVPLLRERPFICGPIYGVLVYLVMFYLVIPLSAIGIVPAFVVPRSVFELLMHVIGIGLPAAWFASRAR